MIINLIKSLQSLPTEKFKEIILKTNQIVQYNKEHFFGEKFEKILLNEMHVNFQSALAEQEYLFNTALRNILFSNLDLIYQRNGKKANISKTLLYMKSTYPKQYQVFYKKYNHLF
jgi:hypothetical protein